jgi:hypothetical protein
MHRRLILSAMALAFFTGAAVAADDVATAVVGSVKAIDKGTKTVVVKTKSGTEQTVHFTGKAIEHGAVATGKGTKDAFEGLKEGDDVVIHYTVKGADKTAVEVDHVGKDGLKVSVAAVKSVDRGAKTVTVKTAEGAEETYHLTDLAVKDTAKGLKTGGKETIYYTEDAGKKIAHFFASN